MSFLYCKISSLSGQEAAHTVMATLAKHFAGVAILSSPWQEQLSLISTVTPDVYCHQYAALLLKGRKTYTYAILFVPDENENDNITLVRDGAADCVRLPRTRLQPRDLGTYHVKVRSSTLTEA